MAVTVASPIIDWAGTNKPRGLSGTITNDLNKSTTPVVYNSAPLWRRAPDSNTVINPTHGYPVA